MTHVKGGPVHRKEIRLTLAVWGVCALLLLSLTRPVSAENSLAEANHLVEKARITLEKFVNTPRTTDFRKQLITAKAVLIVPEFLQAGIIFGGAGGSGVLLVRDEESSKWSNPGFYTMISASVGLQFGAKASELMLLVMTDKGLDWLLLSQSFKLGGDVSVAAGPGGTGRSVATADFIPFMRSKGFFGGLTIEGSMIKRKDSRNEAYYGQKASPLEILVRGSVHNPHAAPLRELMNQATKEKPFP